MTPVFYGSGSTNAPDPASLTEGLPINIPQTAGSVLMKATQIVKNFKQGMNKLVGKHALGVSIPTFSLLQRTWKIILY